MADQSFIDRLLYLRRAASPAPIASGLYHYMREHDGLYTRFHLRVEPDGCGMLIANATAAAHLNPAGVVIAHGLLEGESEALVLHRLEERFRGATQGQMSADLAQVNSLLKRLVEPGDVYPILNLDDPAVSPYEAQLMAPLAAVLPLAEPDALAPLFDRLWAVGIPQALVLVPEQFEASHLVQAVEHAENLGMICGVSGRASDLVPGTLLDDLAMAGVDHVTVFYSAADPLVHDELFGAGDHEAAKEVFTRTQALEVADVGHVPLVTTTVARLEETLTALLELMVLNAAFYAIASPQEMGDGSIPAEGMRQVATMVEEEADEAQVRFLWEPPVQRDAQKSLVTQVRDGPRCSGDLAIRIQPDGSVIPPRGAYQVAGNLLRDEWEAIWGHPAFRRYRERVEAPTRCEVCPGLAICAADCPREPFGWSH